MIAVVIVPRSLESWTQDGDYRVDYLNRHVGSRCLVYFADAPEAVEFAKHHKLSGKPCVVQSKTMQATHEVRSFAPHDPTYIFWSKSFGDLESARDEFERGRDHAMQSGGGYSLVEVGRVKPIASYSKTVD